MNEHAKKLHHQIIAALEGSPLAKVELQDYADSLGVSLRSAQRYIKELQNRDEYEIHRRAHDGARYFKRADAPPIGRILEDATWLTNDDPGSFVVCVACDSLLLLDLSYSSKNKSKKEALSSATGQTTATTNGDAPVTIWYEETSGDFQALANSVCTVCRLNAMLLLPEDEKKIMQLFKANVEPLTIEKRYGRMYKPNYWYNMHWKGITDAYPTLIDIMKTWEMSGGYVYRKYHNWPPVAQIQDSMIAIMKEYGRKQPKLAMDKYTEFGYDEIVKRIPGGYYQMTMMQVETLRIKIAMAVRDIKKEGKRTKALSHV